MSGKAIPAASNYRGLRISYTQIPGSDTAMVTVAVKQVRGRWDDWSLLFPAVRLGGQSPNSTRDVLEALGGALEAVAAMMEG